MSDPIISGAGPGLTVGPGGRGPRPGRARPGWVRSGSAPRVARPIGPSDESSTRPYRCTGGSLRPAPSRYALIIRST
eukprot:747939-Hanusia_phi.AAC.1